MRQDRSGRARREGGLHGDLAHTTFGAERQIARRVVADGLACGHELIGTAAVAPDMTFQVVPSVV